MVSSIEKTGANAQRFAEAANGSYRVFVDHAFAVQERNLKFWQGILDETVREARRQAESNRALAQELIERVEQQRDAFRTLVDESVDAYLDLLYAPLAYYRQGLRLVDETVESGVPVVEFPIAGYDELSVEEISKRLDGLTAAEIRLLLEHEKRNKKRETLIERYNRRLKATPA